MATDADASPRSTDGAAQRVRGEVPERLSPPAPPRLRRRGLLAIGIAVTALAGLAGAWLYTATTDTHAVVAMARSVARGEVISAADLTVVDISLDPALDPVAARDRDQVIGRRAAADLSAGGILAADAVTAQVVPPAGEELVGLAVTPAQLPVEPLLPGDSVRVVDTPREQDDPPSTEPRSTLATVVNVGSLGETGRIVVDVTVPADQAAHLAARAATGRIALVLQSRERS